MVRYPPSSYILSSLRKLKFYKGRGPGARDRITQTPVIFKLYIKHGFVYKLIWRAFVLTFIQNGTYINRMVKLLSYFPCHSEHFIQDFVLCATIPISGKSI